MNHDLSLARQGMATRISSYDVAFAPIPHSRSRHEGLQPLNTLFCFVLSQGLLVASNILVQDYWTGGQPRRVPRPQASKPPLPVLRRRLAKSSLALLLLQIAPVPQSVCPV